MNQRRYYLKILIGVLCAVLLILVAFLALLLDSQSPEPIFGVFQTEPTATTEDPQLSTEYTGGASQEPGTSDQTGEPQNTTETTGGASQETRVPDVTDKPQNPTETTGESSQETEPTEPTEEQITPPEELPPSVEIPPETDPEGGEEAGITFPCQIPGYDISIEKLAPYDGMFVEDGSNADAKNVAMLLVKNNGDYSVEYAQIRVQWGQETLQFDISALPAGEKMVVQEKTGKAISGDEAAAASALVVQRANMEMSESKVQVTDNGNNTLTIKNLTNETIPTVRVFYKYYMEDEELYVGGIAFTVRVLKLGAGASVTIQPSHYNSQTSRVVMVLTYDSEV